MLMHITYNMTDVRDLAKRFPDVVLAETESVLDLIVTRLKKDIAEGTPKGVTSALMDSILAGGEVVPYGMKVAATLGTAVPYGEVIELGRRPGKTPPPYRALMSWVRSILDITEEKEQKSAAIAVAKKIGVEGFEGAHMFQKAWDKDERWIEDQLRTIVPRVVARLEAGA